jgi:AsmA protein
MKKAFRIGGISLSVILLVFIFLFFTPFLFKDKFTRLVKESINKNLKTELNFSSLDVSFFHHFPNLTITLSDFILRSSPPFEKDTLVSARDISFGVNLASLFKGPLKINRVYLNHGKVALKYNVAGLSNFDIYNSSPDSAKKAEKTSGGGLDIRIEDIFFIQTDFLYSDPSVPMKIAAHGINYNGQSDLSKDILHLASKVRIDSLDFLYDNVPYLKSKPVKADLMTSIDLNTLHMKFEKNDLHIKDIPFEFRGEFNFRKDGYTFFLSMFSMIGEEYLSASLWLVSSKHLFIALKANLNLTLQNWVKGFGIKDTDLRGKFSLKVDAQGDYYTGQNPGSSKPDTILLSIPDFTVTSTLRDGYFRYKPLPSSIEGISFDLTSSTTKHDYRSIRFAVENLKAAFLKNRIEGYFRMKGGEDLPVEARLSTNVNLAEIQQVIPLDSLELGGNLDLKLDISGKYSPAKKMFPVSSVDLSLKEGVLKTRYYPEPIRNINVHAVIINKTGMLSGTTVDLDPASINFEGSLFEIRGKLSDPDNLSYNIASKGSLDLAKIYHVFSRQGMDLEGFISTDLHLQGRQSDALAGRYERLNNSGKLTLKNIGLRSEFLPEQFVIKTGIFRFDNDKIWFEKFDSRLGTSDIMMDGHLSNVVNYFLSEKQVLKGKFTFRSNQLVVDEFIAPASETSGETRKPEQSVSSTSSGVVVIPDNIEIGLNADVKKIIFGTLEIRDFNSVVEVQKGLLLLKSMNFGLAGCKVSMDASYGSINTDKAFFDFHVKAEDFDILRAYNEVPLFRSLSTSAGKCEGIVSLEYALKGSLDQGMRPIFPSLEGGGVLSLKKVKVIGLKLFTAMSKNLSKEKISNPDLSKVEIKSSIKNNVITLERTKMKIAGFRFRVEGESNFNGSLNLKTRLGLPPLGIVGIPIRVLGTQENPKFKYGRGVNDLDVETTEYTDEVPKEFLDKIKSAKEEELKDEPGGD